jgi:hypothetical protein
VTPIFAGETVLCGTPTAAFAKASWASEAGRASESCLAGGGMNIGEESLRNFADIAIEKMGIASFNINALFRFPERYSLYPLFRRAHLNVPYRRE